jgi:short-subunit dehydrogenase
MKVLILGADGMIGHKMAQTFSENNIDLALNSRDNSKFLEEHIFQKQIFLNMI